MKNRYQELIKFVLANASPNIQYRVRKEILKESINTPEMLSLQAQMEFWNNVNFRRTDIIERIEYHF